MLVVLASLAVAACPTTSSDLDEALGRAEAAYAAMDAAALRSAADEAALDATCLSNRPGGTTIASLHRVEGLVAFVEHDDERARSAFAAAKVIEPDYAFPVAVVPPGTAAALLYGGAPSSPPLTGLVAPPLEGRIEVDGVPGNVRPLDRPALVLIFGADDAVTASGYIWPSDPMPPYERGTSGPNRPLLALGGASLLAAGALYGANLAVHASYGDVDPYSAEGQRIRRANNALVVADVGLGVVALASGVGAFVVGRW